MSNFWIQTWSGKAFDLTDFTLDDIDIEDIAHALANQCRYNGHSRQFYSVAQHSVLVSLEVEAAGLAQLHLWDQAREDVRILALWGLLHDAAEAYIGDLVSPVKRYLDDDADGGFGFLEGRIQGLIVKKFGLPQEPHELIKEYDLRLLATERRDLFGPCPRDWRLKYPPLDRRISGSPPLSAECEFLRRFEKLQGRS